MPELLEGLEQLATERGNAIERARQRLTEEPEGLLIVAREVCNFVDLIYEIWAVTKRQLSKGGVSARLFLRLTESLLRLCTKSAEFLDAIVTVWPERKRNLPEEFGEPFYAVLQSARQRLDTLAENLRTTREMAAAPSRTSPSPEEVLRRVEQSNEGGTWVRLPDAISRIRQGTQPKQE